MQEIGYKPDTLRALHAPRIAWKTTTTVVLATGLVAICAHIAVPLGFTPIPVTMQTFAVLLLGLLFSPGAAFACLALYLMEGALGLPVFSPHGPGGIAQLLGPTGGYLLSYPLAAGLASLLYRRSRRSFATGIAAAGLASLLILAVGATWLGLLSHCNFLSFSPNQSHPSSPAMPSKWWPQPPVSASWDPFGDASRNRTL